VFEKKGKIHSSDQIKGRPHRSMCLPQMWYESQDENALDWQGQAKKVLSAMQNFCFIRGTSGFLYGAHKPEHRNRMIACRIIII
jgi:hypothetical protein